ERTRSHHRAGPYPNSSHYKFVSPPHSYPYRTPTQSPSGRAAISLHCVARQIASSCLGNPFSSLPRSLLSFLPVIRRNLESPKPILGKKIKF
ncbi:hypothetical protein GW17_00007232, partial [Ensete ventricosum]